MYVLGYRKTLRITDDQARDLGITTETPFICLWVDQKNRVFLTNAFLLISRPKHFDCFTVKMQPKGWKVTLKLPFPWEEEYQFVKTKNGVFQLTNTKPKKEAINGKTTPTVSRGRYRKAKKLQNLRNIKSTSYGQDANITDTLI